MKTKSGLRSTTTIVWLTIAVITGLWARTAIADEKTPDWAQRDMVKEAAIWREIQAIDQHAVEDFKAGTAAFDSENYEAAISFYQKVYKTVPGLDAVNRRLGSALVYAGHSAQGLPFIETAVRMKRSPENLYSLARALAYPTATAVGSASEKQRALSLIKEAQYSSDAKDPSYLLLGSQLSIDLERIDDLEEMSGKLVEGFPEIMQGHYLYGIVLANRGDWAKAEKEMKTAEALGLPPDAAKALLDARPHWWAVPTNWAYLAGCLVGAWILGLLLLFGVGKLLSAMTMRFVNAASDDGSNSSVSQSQLSFRGLYRSLINFAGFYYYLSYPFVFVLVVGIPVGLLYLSLMAGRIPIGLIAGLGIAGAVTAFSMIRTLFVRRKSEDPGRPLGRQEAPGLFDLARQVAVSINTRPMDEIRITPGTQLAVYERGSVQERSADRAHRILILGVGLLNDFKQDAFRCVLAHEYGHLSHRDTAGGDVALRVNAHIMDSAVAIINAGQNTRLNAGFHFLRIYLFIFRRISHGATRFQEMLADRVAVLTYGAAAFEEGLRHVVRRGVELEDVAYWEASDARRTGRAIQNIYEMAPADEQRIEEKIQERINRKTSEDDTHPAPADRFRFAARIRTPGQDPIGGFMWDLFADRVALTAEMTALINRGG